MSGNDAKNILHKLEDHFKEEWKSLGKINILIAGRSGVGKSTLINAVFEGDFATVLSLTRF